MPDSEELEKRFTETNENMKIYKSFVICWLVIHSAGSGIYKNFQVFQTQCISKILVALKLPVLF